MGSVGINVGLKRLYLVHMHMYVCGSTLPCAVSAHFSAFDSIDKWAQDDDLPALQVGGGDPVLVMLRLQIWICRAYITVLVA